MTSTPFLIVGCPRSGTTLLAALLDQIPGVTVLPETDVMLLPLAAAARRGHEALVDAWLASRRAPDLGLDRSSVLAALRDRPAEPAHLLGALMAATADRAGARVVGEKTPEHLRHIPELLAALPGLRVICLQRDGRDVVLSLMRAPFTHDWLRVHCHRWLDAVTLAGDLAERHAERFRIVRFEDLVADPDTTLAEVGVFLDIDGANSSRESSPPGILVPSRELAWKSKALSPPDSSRIAAWRREPDTRRLAIIEGILAESLLALGHPLDATPRVSLKDRALSIFARIAYRAGYHGLRNRLPESARNALQRTMKIVTR